jgi:hypothetical protein
MKTEWAQQTILHVASLLAPRDRRTEWLEEWRSELWYVPHREAFRFCLGAFADAFWVRRNNSAPGKPGRFRLDSPFHCLAFLATLAALSIWISTRLAKLLPLPEAPGDVFAQMALICLPLAAITFAIGDGPGKRNPALGSGKLRGWIFLALKILLLLPILQCMMMMIVLAPFLEFGFFLAYALAFRWAFADQRRRCPVCLRLLTQPVLIGNSSQTLLDWYGAESMCSRGHGLLHVPEISASYSYEQWLTLDDAWSDLVSEDAGARRC